MKTAKELYPEYWQQEQQYGRFYGPGDYQPIINEIGKVIIQVDDNDYQGDTRILYKNGNKYGYLIFGWGSCSGCDALQACNNMDEIQDLIKGLVNDVKWYNNLEDLQKYFKEKDWELEFEYHSDETKEFIKKVLDYKEIK